MSALDASVAATSLARAQDIGKTHVGSELLRSWLTTLARRVTQSTAGRLSLLELAIVPPA